MKIIDLTEKEYENYANNNDANFGQTLEYSRIKANRHKEKLFLGMIDSNSNIAAATLILIHNVSSFAKEAIAPNGFIIDYANFELVAKFTELLKNYLLKEKVTYLITNPMFKYHVYNQKNIMIENNDDIYNNLLRLNYDSIGYFSDFEHYDIIIENSNSINDIYRNFNRNTKRNIKSALNLGITLHKGDINDLPLAYEIIKKKSHRNYEFYEDLMRIYNTKNNEIGIFFAKLNPHKYLVNVQKLYENEKIKNEKIHEKFKDNAGKIKEKLFNKKINSDNTLEKYREELSKAIALNQKYSSDVVVGTSIIIKNNTNT